MKVKTLHKFKELPEPIWVNGIVVKEDGDRFIIRVTFGDGARLITKNKKDIFYEREK